MQAVKISNKIFLAIADEIQQIQKGENIRDFVITMLLHSKLREWNKDNIVKLLSIQDSITKLRKEFFVFESADQIIDGEKVPSERVKTYIPEPVAEIPAVYEEKKVSRWWQKTKFEKTLISPSVARKEFAPTPICLEGKTIEEFDMKYNLLMDSENEMKY